MTLGRRSIHVEGFEHTNPIPAACRIGPFVFSGAVTGRDPITRQMPADPATQCANVFRHVREIVEAAGGNADQIAKMTFWLADPSDRAALNREWTAMFPDPDNRPARHVVAAALSGGSLIQADFIAVLDPETGGRLS